MKLAFSTNAYTNGRYSILDAVNRIADVGYAGVEILADKPLVWVPTITKREIKSLRSILSKRKLEVSTVNGFTASGYYGDRKAPPGQDFGPSFSDYEKGLRRYKIDYTRKVIDFAVEIGATNISVGSGYKPKEGTAKEAWEHVRQGLEAVVAYAEKKKVFINLEYEPYLVVGNARDAARMLKEVDSPNLGLNFDIGHSFVCGEDVARMIRRFKDKINSVHVEDIGLGKDRKPVHYHLIPGQGVMPLREIFKALRDIGYSGYYTVELYNFSKRPVYATKAAFRGLKNIIRSIA